MLFQKALLRELRTAAGAVFAVLLTTLATTMLIRALGRAASGRIEGELVSPLIIFTMLNSMNSVLVLTIYISVLIVLTRWWRDSEMVVWLTSGKSLQAFLKPIWLFIWPLLVIAAIFSFLVAPWSEQQYRNFETQVENRTDLQRISPGYFRESSSGTRVFFLENIDNESGLIGTVFVRSMAPDGQQTVLVSASGRFEADSTGQQWVVLEKGYRTDLMVDGLESRTTQFDYYRARIDPSVPVIGSKLSEQSKPTLQLLDETSQPSALAELLMRINLPLLGLGLGFLAVPLAYVNARSGRAISLIIALLIYLIGTNLLASIKVSVAQSRMDFVTGVGLLPLVTMVLIVFLFWWRSRPRRGPVEWLMAVAQLALKKRQMQRATR
jgi:lipopolysaccharide export system permease protein